MSRTSKKVRGSLAVSTAAIALSEKPTIARPAGSMKPFCEPVTATSTPHSSKRKSIEAIELTPSTKSSAGWEAASIARLTAAMSERTPVAVSLWVASTTLISWPVSARRISS